MKPKNVLSSNPNGLFTHAEEQDDINLIMNVNQLAQVFAAIPANITNLNLNNLHLQPLNANQLAQVFADLPTNITTLDLDENDTSEVKTKLA